MTIEQVRVAADPAQLAARVRELGAAGGRVIVGIVGAPGGGKSTLVQALVQAIGPTAVEVPMDGFHLAQHVLDEAGLARVKGAPQTFDGDGYLALMSRIRTPRGDEVIYAPTFRRDLEEPIAGAIAIRSDHRFVITEGNYLLLDSGPWPLLRTVLDQIWFLDTPEEVRLERLVARHIHFGWSPEGALERATSGSDGDNGRVVLATRDRADLLLDE